ncbi:MAG: hypothetical protein CML16_05255 [Pusillimonas sp.]|nr:hypothetical protein [Pusillimonas sp.]MBC41301.1 hypothetical protein [Pusillimonas sp.]|tara:strand:- start:40249 stop:41313 length:1065 start_codon:yes stop_codon:yes gene_type:complete
MSVARFGLQVFFALLFYVGLQSAWADIPPPSADKPTLVTVDLKLEDINDIKLGSGTFDLTAQFGMRWHDPRLAFTPEAGRAGPRIWMGARAEQQLQQIWHPIIDVNGEKGLSVARIYSLSIWPDGNVELREKFSAMPRFDGELTWFPFGHLTLSLTLTSAAMDRQQIEFELGELTPKDDLAAVDRVIHGNWAPEEVRWSVSERNRMVHSNHLYPQIDLDIRVEHDFLDGVHKVLLPLIVIALASWGLLWLNPTVQPAFSSPRIGGTTTLILTTIAMKFVLGRELPVVHYLTLADVLFNVTIVMLTIGLLTSCLVVALFTARGADAARPLNRAITQFYPLAYIGLLSVSILLFVE